MPTYNPTESRYLTLAQTRTNDGTKDVKLILDTLTNTFYTLDDAGNFDAVDNETASTIQTLSVGTLEGDGANPITLESPLVKGGGEIRISDTNIVSSFSGENGQTTFRVSEILTQTDAEAGDVLAIAQVGINQIYLEYTETAAGDPLYQTSIALASGYLDLVMSSDPEAAAKQLQLNNFGVLIDGLPSYADEADAESGGLTSGQLYITDGSAASPLNVAGIVMMKL